MPTRIIGTNLIKYILFPQANFLMNGVKLWSPQLPTKPSLSPCNQLTPNLSLLRVFLHLKRNTEAELKALWLCVRTHTEAIASLCQSKEITAHCKHRCSPAWWCTPLTPAELQACRRLHETLSQRKGACRCLTPMWPLDQIASRRTKNGLHELVCYILSTCTM